jgi:hypothetical protein
MRFTIPARGKWDLLLSKQLDAGDKRAICFTEPGTRIRAQSAWSAMVRACSRT